jgi:Fe-S oxidoreductase
VKRVLLRCRRRPHVHGGDPGQRINVNRAEEVMRTGAATVAAACPFCATMLSDGLMDKESTVAVKDIAEIVDEATA